ncbi:hypothetical protein [Peptostreptococcus sp. D1]|uniref:hypothetical protein n=1 Tax=Peptostreptococcus sp. D1 TaxID=72304 RepID=UPI0008ED36FC|nr:hypothetical protein [Peptostreptococcus sp. D1]SFE89428.1 hypothetical protein SAMN02910278_01983 [Peptostreptococcus sp. D1]
MKSEVEALEKAWKHLNQRGVYTLEQANDLFETVEDIDFGFLATPLDMVALEKKRREVFGYE